MTKLNWTELIQIADRVKKERDEAYLSPPKEMPELPGITKALQKGCHIHAFLSGGGLRVIRLENKQGTLVGYGEHPHAEIALRHIDEDYLAGGRPYHQVYGSDAKYDQYLTGDTNSTSNLDWWIRKGCTFDSWMEDDQVVFQLNGYTHYEIPEWVREQTQRYPGTSVTWKNRGITYATVYKEHLFANGEGGHSAEVIQKPKEAGDAWFYKIKKIGKGSSFWQAMLNAFDAPELEIKD